MPGLWKSTSSAGRPTAGHQSSIRGRISGPIPIPKPDDDEFPIRTPGSGIAIPANDPEFEFPIRKPGSRIATTYPLPEEVPETEITPAQEQQLLPPPPEAGTSAVSVSGSHTDTTQNSNGNGNGIQEAPLHPPPEPASESRSSSGQHVARTSPSRTSASRTSASRTSPPRRTSPPVRRTNPPSSAIRYSTLSEAPTAQSKDGAPPKRKKSTLRTALGRLFGRKKKSESQGSTSTSGRTSGMMSSAQHRSDPSALSRSKDSEPKRSASLPITEYDRALRSHSIGPDDITAIESVRNSLQATTELGSSPVRKRAATTGGRLYSPHYSSSLRAGRADLEGGWAGGLSPRPASTHGRGSRLTTRDIEDPSEIGRAITSDSGGGHRRRSRSLSGLKDITIATGAPGGDIRAQEVRRRSDEIRYWRESYDRGFLSPLSSDGPDEGERVQEPDQDNDDTKSGLADESAPTSPVGDNQPREQQPLPKTPPQPFNFGSITRDMVGMKITQAASMDTRIGGLESRMARLERVVDQLCHAVPGFKTPLMETPLAGPTSHPGITSDPSPFSFAFTSTAAPPMIPAIYQAMSSDPGIMHSSHGSAADETDSMHHSSHLSFGEAQTYIGSLHPPSSSATGTQSLTATAPPAQPTFHPSNRPTSNSTVRGATSLPTLGRDAASSENDDYTAALLSQVESERVARQSLEAQVAKLSQRLNTLSATMYALVRSDGGLAKARSQEQLLQPPTPSAPATQQVNTASIPKKPALRTLSVFDTEEDDKPVEDEDDRQTEEDFLTPGEERSTLGIYHYGAFGEQLRDEDLEDEQQGNDRHVGDDDSKRKKAARTLSLSQLTLGKKGSQAQVQT